MKLNQVPNFRVEDFIGQQEWIGRLFIQLNPFVQSINQIIDKNLDYTYNIKSVTRSYDITSFTAFSFTWPYSDAAPIDLRIVKAQKGSTLTPTILQAAWEYDPTNQLISVTRMTEINESSVSALSGRYKFTIRVTV